MEWTREQKRIIDIRNKNILVSAAAGSGKTAVLVERIISLIKNDGENIDKFLIVTFTNAAAGGMRQKIQRALLSSIQNNEGNLTHLRRQLSLLSKANISTIHSFCIDVIRKNFHIIGIDPNFRIGDTNETEILLNEAVDEVLERAYGEKKSGFISLVESFTKNRDDSELCDIIKEIYRFIQSFPEPLDWLKNSVNMLKLNEAELNDSIWMKAVAESISVLLQGAEESLMYAKLLCEDVDGPTVYLEALLDDLNNLQILKDSFRGDFELFINNIHSISHAKLKAIKGEDKNICSEKKQTEVKALRDEYKKIIENVKKMLPNKGFAEFVHDINYMHPSMLSLYSIIEDLSNTFRAKKTEKVIIDFNDVEHYALEILKNNDISESYRNKYNHIFIDEYQDSNRLQETLIDQIKRKNNVFMVGDVKQSIYRFRLADPSLFNEKYCSYHLDNHKTDIFKEITDIRIDLNKNFRSTKTILDGTNYIFKSIMSEKIGEINYNEDVFLNCGSSFDSEEENYIEIDIIDKNTEDDEDTDDEIKSMRTAEIEARFAVNKIKDFLKQKIYISKKEEYRDIEYKDIVILMRSVANWAPVFEEIFSDEGIPFYFDGGEGYFESIEIQVMLNLLKLIDNIRQDIPLISIMRSPIGNFTTDELTKVRAAFPKLQYIDAVYAYKNKGNDKLSIKLKEFIEKIEGWKKRCRYSHLNEFIWEILMETGYYYFVGILPKGNLRQANLRLLTDKAFEYEKTSMRGLFNFLRFIEKLNISSGDTSTAKILGENDNVVRLMSVHKSKGLEFPVVLLCGMSKRFNKADLTKNILKHNNLGLAPKYINTDERVYRETIPRLALKNTIKVENMSEEMRVLYVAMTRAVNKLVLIGTVNKIETKAKKWAKGPSQYNIYTGDSFMDWICMSLYSHKDFKSIRQLIGDEECSYAVDNFNSSWLINRITLSQIECELLDKSFDKLQKINEIAEFKNKHNSPLMSEINRRLSYSYKYQGSVNVPTKLSVTDLRILKDDKLENIEFKIPALKDIPIFNKTEDEFTKAEIGTIVHFVMQHLDISVRPDRESISIQINEMICKNLLTEKEAATINVNMLADFFDTNIGRRMINSQTVKREVPFVIKKKAKEIINSIDGNDSILIQGIIDCYFYEGDEVVIIDYKTDDITQVSVDMIKNKYKPQILSYKEAVERLTNKKVKGCYLYLFDIGQSIEIE